MKNHVVHSRLWPYSSCCFFLFTAPPSGQSPHPFSRQAEPVHRCTDLGVIVSSESNSHLSKARLAHCQRFGVPSPTGIEIPTFFFRPLLAVRLQRIFLHRSGSDWANNPGLLCKSRFFGKSQIPENLASATLQSEACVSFGPSQGFR